MTNLRDRHPDLRKLSPRRRLHLTAHKPPRLNPHDCGRCGYQIPPLPMAYNRTHLAASAVWPNEDATKCPCWSPKPEPKPPGPNRLSSQVRKYCVEKRHPETGALDLSGPQPPFTEATKEEIVHYFFRQVRGGEKSFSNDEIGEWYAARGWFWRPKTW